MIPEQRRSRNKWVNLTKKNWTFQSHSATSYRKNLNSQAVVDVTRKGYKKKKKKNVKVKSR